MTELRPGEEFVARDVELKRGLNIVWAPWRMPERLGTGVESGGTGHTAGKTTFCRLVRHVLGEDGLGSTATRRRIRKAFPDGWVLGEILVNDERWCVARPFGQGHRPFAIRNGTFEDATADRPRLPYTEFVGVLDSLTATSLEVARFPVNDEPVRWSHLLPWLTRDQECRFADELVWRHSASDSGSPALSMDEHNVLVRAMLGLITEEEHAERMRSARLIREKTNAEASMPQQKYLAQMDYERLAAHLGISSDGVPLTMLEHTCRQEVRRREGALAERERQLSEMEQPLAELEKKEADAKARRDEAKEKLHEVRGRRRGREATLVELQGADLKDAIDSAQPSAHWCGHTAEQARLAHCPLVTVQPTVFNIAAVRKSRNDDRSRLNEHIERDKEMELEYERQLRQEDSAHKTALSNFAKLKTKHEDLRSSVERETRELAAPLSLLRAAETSLAGASRLQERIEQGEKQVAESRKLQERLREHSTGRLIRFSNRFEKIVHGLLADESTARVDQAGRRLEFIIEDRGKRESAALSTVKLLGFDLAALVASMEGHGSHPRFLIHDGPREADMAPDIYERLFWFARALEAVCSGEPPFQYILTTTTDPPVDLQDDKRWLRMKLAAHPAEDRFLRRNL